MVDQCSICLKDLRDDIGTFVPCGHCIHVKCFKEYLANHRRKASMRRRNASHGSGHSHYDHSIDTSLPRCPLCLTSSTHFQKIYLNVSSSAQSENNAVPQQIASISNIKISAPSNLDPPLSPINQSRQTQHISNDNSPKPQEQDDAEQGGVKVCWRAYDTLPSLEELHQIALIQRHTMLIQREVNLIQRRYEADLHVATSRLDHYAGIQGALGQPREREEEFNARIRKRSRNHPFNKNNTT